MKHLVVIPFESNFTVPNRLFTTLENIEVLANQNEDVTVLYCDGGPVNLCWTNPDCNKGMCRYCKMYKKMFFKALSKNVKFLPSSQIFKASKEDYDKLQFSYKTNEEIKKIYYKNVGIGYAALSAYLTSTRNLFPLCDEYFCHYMDANLRAGTYMTDLINKALDVIQPDRVESFNNRFVFARPVFDTCKYRKIDILVLEDCANRAGKNKRNNFLNETAHNIAANIEHMNHFWESDYMPVEEKMKIGESFFYNRRNAIPAGDKVYVKDQQMGLLPDNWDTTKHNIVIFNSSEDEMASLGEEFERRLYTSQYHGIADIFRKNKDAKDYHFYLRVHPNLKDIPFAYHTKLYELDQISDNVTVIPGDSPVSTYALMEAAEKIIVFGSSTGLEAAFFGKPVILLSNCQYAPLDICYMPKDKIELQQMIYADLTPKDKLPAIKLAYYRFFEELPDFEYFPYKLQWHKMLGRNVSSIKLLNPKHWWLNIFSSPIRWLGTVHRHRKCFYFSVCNEDVSQLEAE